MSAADPSASKGEQARLIRPIRPIGSTNSSSMRGGAVSGSRGGGGRTRAPAGVTAAAGLPDPEYQQESSRSGLEGEKEQEEEEESSSPEQELPLGPADPSRGGRSNGDSIRDTWRSCLSRLDDFFLVSKRHSSISQEVRAGAVTFVTMVYIIVVNAAILSASGTDAAGHSLHFDSVVLATALSASFGSFLVGMVANLPFALAPGMGLNSYFTYGVCLKLGLSWRVALACCFVQGILFMILALVGACELLQHYAPQCIKKGITMGLGIFQALVGFELMKLVVPGEEVLLQMGDLGGDPRIWVSLGGMALICVLLVWKVKGAMLVGMVAITAVGWIMDPSTAPAAGQLMAFPTFQEHPLTILDLRGFWAERSQTILVTLVMLFVAVFDTAGVQYMCGTGAGLMDEEDKLPGAKAAFFAAGAATTFGACLGTSPIIIHNETFAGISDGARTGLHSVVVALLFLLCLPFVPLLRVVPPIATAAPLVIVGMHMMVAAKHIKWEETHEAMPAFLCAAILPLTYSIANGMVFGLAAYALLKGAHTLGLQIAPGRFQAALEEERHLLEEREQLELDRKCGTCGGSMTGPGARERR